MDPGGARAAAEGLGPAWDDVFTLADWDSRIGQVPEEGRRFFVRPAEEGEGWPPEREG